MRIDVTAAGERAQTLVLMALAMLGLLAAIGLATDGSVIYVTQRHLQRALDAAALAAANKLPDQDEARDAAYQFMRLHDYDFDPVNHPLSIDFPTTVPPRKITTVEAAVETDLFFLRLLGWQKVEVMAMGEGESAPLDVYLVLDLSHSMVGDTPKPGWWGGGQQTQHCESYIGQVSNDCVKYCKWGEWQAFKACYCNAERNCNPLDAHVKPAAKFFVDQLDSRYDRVGVVGYHREGRTYQTLTDNFGAVKSTIDSMDAYTKTYEHYPNAWLCTNIGDGILYANVEMSQNPPPASYGGRIDSVWSTVLLTDGRANTYRDCPGCPDNCGGPTCGATDDHCTPWSGYCPKANQWAKNNAWSAWTLHKIVVYTIAYGDIFFDPSHGDQYRQLMIDIADITDNGDVDGDTDNFWAAPDEAGLRDALAEIAERIYTRLLR
jgi:hypothetical protein